MKLKIIALAIAAFAFASCNTSSNSSNGNPPPNNPGGNDLLELGYDPAQRWTDQGDFSYSHRYTYNGATCETGEQRFGNRAEYCMALQDQKLNNNCALPSRRSNYKSECGNDFQELNFRSEFYKSGYDAFLQKQCSTDDSIAFFRNAKHYCDFLKDEVLHENCFWTDRYKHFKAKSCTGDFSKEPEQIGHFEPGPQPQPVEPNPQPNPQPTPIPDPVQDIPIVKELKEQGITTEVDWQSIRIVSSNPMPGEPSVDQKMKVLWAELAANKIEILKRKAQINQIEVSIYTNFHNFGEVKQFVLDFETKANTLKDYFPLSDKIQTYEKELNIKFNTIHSGSYSDKVSYLPLRQMNAAIEKNFADLKSGYGLFAEIKTDTYAAYFSKSQTLTLRREYVDTDLIQYLRLLKPLAPVMNWSKKNSVDLEADFEIERQSREVQEAFKIIENSLSSLDQMVKAGMLKQISLYFNNDDSNYYGSLKNLFLNVGPANQKRVTEAIVKVGKMAQLITDGGVEITISGNHLNDDFFKAFSYLEKFWPKIKSKISKIQKIELSYESKFYSGLKQLMIGSQSSEADTEKVINDIK